MSCCSVSLLFLIPFLAYATLKIYLKLSTGWCKSRTCLVGKTALITGANSGIGYETALDFAKRGARVILACRDPRKAEDACRRITEETGNENVAVKLIDMSSFESVRACADEISKEDRLDILVNNAGVYGIGDQRSKDGHALLMQSNYYSPFLLTNLLMHLLKKSQSSRIINVSSFTAKRATRFDVGKIDQFVSSGDDYYNSKLCNILFTVELAKKLQGTGVSTYSLCPGVVKTNILSSTKGITKLISKMITSVVAKTAEEGAQTTIYCSVTKGIEKFNGEHFVDCHRVEPYSTATDSGLAKKLWEKTEEIVGLHGGIQF